MERIGVIGVFVGKPAVIGEIRGRPIESGIAKAPVSAPELELAPTNLEGDRQADLTVHGGPDKAVYAYPSEHYAAWRDDGFELEVGGVGENLALAGATEHDVLLGDVWRWGDALVQVSQPRAPCFKLAIHAGRKDVGPRMTATGRCGWYLRVIEPGTVPTGGELVLHDRPLGAPTVAETFRALFDPGGHEDGVVAKVVASPALAESWRSGILARQERAS
jgi:MOSC domain-containing protein YiiM